jgi:hypothetical protein
MDEEKIKLLFEDIASYLTSKMGEKIGFVVIASDEQAIDIFNYTNLSERHALLLLSVAMENIMSRKPDLMTRVQ